jgi:hypothetical protein
MSEHDEPIPTRGKMGAYPVPDLSRLPRERWAEALRQVPFAVREKAAWTLGDLKTITEAGVLAREIEAQEQDRRKAARDAIAFPGPLPGGRGALPRRPRYQQVNFRLLRGQHERLCEAAAMLGMKPTQLARTLTLRGVAQVIAEVTAHDAATRASGAP